MKKLNYQNKAYVIHLIISAILILLSLIGLFFGIWELVVSVSIGATFSFVSIFSLFNGASAMNATNTKTEKVIISSILRFLAMVLGIVIPAIIIKLTDDGNKLRYLNVIGSTIPFLMINLSLNLIKNDILKDGE